MKLADKRIAKPRKLELPKVEAKKKLSFCTSIINNYILFRHTVDFVSLKAFK